MENEKELTKVQKINQHYKEFFEQLRTKMKDELTLTDSKMHSTMMNRGRNHEYYVSLMVEEKRKLKEAEASTERMQKKLIKHYMSPAAKIQAGTITEAKDMVNADERFIVANAELGWRRKIVDYLTEMNKVLTKQYFTVTNILDWYKLDPSNVVAQLQFSKDEQKDD